MACTLHVAWDEQLTEYDFGPGHPLAPVRIELTMALARALGVLGEPGVTVAAPSPASDADLELVHDPQYIAAVRQAGHLAQPHARAAAGAGWPARRRPAGCSQAVRPGHRG